MSYYDAVVFCNKLSVIDGLVPVYSVSNKTGVSEWGYTPHKGYPFTGEIRCNKNENGYRLPTVEEWQYAAKGARLHRYSGSDNLNEVGWYSNNGGEKIHPVAQKKPNDYGLYDMSGNVGEWCWDSDSNKLRYYCGGSFHYDANYCEVGYRDSNNASGRYLILGFRIVRSTGK